MKGAIAAGHPLTAGAGAQVLAAGGNAVDACVAAGFASWVTEGPLTGPGGGGFLLIHRARDHAARLLDFYVAYPGQKAGSPPGDMESVEVDFSGGSTQVFQVGGASCAVPGSAVGLESAHRTYGSQPWRVLLQPAIELAQQGLELNESQAYLHKILDLILRFRQEGRDIYGGEGRLTVGDRLVQRDLGATLELIAERGAGVLSTGPVARRMVEHVAETGGTITEADLAGYRPIWRRPVRAEFRGHRFLSNPPPASGGVLVAYGLSLLDRIRVRGAHGSAAETAVLVEVMREQARVRERGFASRLYRGGLARRLLAPESIALALERIAARQAPTAHARAGISGTTHISVVDRQGNAASLTASNGAGSGIVVPGTGIHLNNMLGEYDLVSAGGAARPGRRLTSLMAPSLVLRGDSPRLVVGSAGSLRLHGAILQAVLNVIGHELPVEDAIARPRVHAEGGVVHCEGGADPAELDGLGSLGYELVRWSGRNLFFGGVAGVEALPDGSLAAAGDPRRGGVGIVV